MNEHAMVASLETFKGKMIKDCIDEIAMLAHAGEYYINIIDPLFNTGSIDNEPNRINVRTDKDSRITSFSIG